jgi:hypothetical protein
MIIHSSGNSDQVIGYSNRPDLREQLRVAIVILLEEAKARNRALARSGKCAAPRSGGVCVIASPRGSSDHDRSLHVRHHS